MGLRDDLQADLAEAYDTDLADAITAFTAKRVTVSDAYDPVTGGYPETAVEYQGRGVMGGYKVAEVDGQHILATDTKLSGVLQNELSDQWGELFEPAIDDVIDGLKVVDVSQDAAKATWTLQLRGA